MKNYLLAFGLWMSLPLVTFGERFDASTQPSESTPAAELLKELPADVRSRIMDILESTKLEHNEEILKALRPSNKMMLKEMMMDNELLLKFPRKKLLSRARAWEVATRNLSEAQKKELGLFVLNKDVNRLSIRTRLKLATDPYLREALVNKVNSLNPAVLPDEIDALKNVREGDLQPLIDARSNRMSKAEGPATEMPMTSNSLLGEILMAGRGKSDDQPTTQPGVDSSQAKNAATTQSSDKDESDDFLGNQTNP